MNKTGVLITGYKHDTGVHPESGRRLKAVEEVLLTPELAPHLSRLTPRRAEVSELEAIHDPDYISRVQEACKGGIHALDPDTVISAESYDQACLAAGGVLTALDAVVSGVVQNAFCAVRPPGHHAERDRAMGFCLFNNVAVAARYAQKKHGLGKILIVDWDVHHGNGTHNAFYEDPWIFYFSIHQERHYPGTGRRDQEGRGAGKGFTRNVPLPAGSGDRAYREAFEEILIPAMDLFIPELILISAGFDAHEEDPLAGMQVTEAGFGYMTDALTRLAEKYCRQRVVSMLEGGYNLAALQRSVHAHLSALIGIS